MGSRKRRAFPELGLAKVEPLLGAAQFEDAFLAADESRAAGSAWLAGELREAKHDLEKARVSTSPSTAGRGQALPALAAGGRGNPVAAAECRALR